MSKGHSSTNEPAYRQIPDVRHKDCSRCRRRTHAPDERHCVSDQCPWCKSCGAIAAEKRR